MKITAFISMATAIGVLAGQAALADPAARNHGVNKRQQTQKDRIFSREAAGQQDLFSIGVDGTDLKPLAISPDQETARCVLNLTRPRHAHGSVSAFPAPTRLPH